MQGMNTNTHALARPRPLALPTWPRAVAWLARVLRPAPSGAGELRGMSELELKDLALGRSEVGHAFEAGRER